MLAGAYAAGGVARAGDDQAHLQRLATAAASGFDDRTIRDGMTPGALAIAERHDLSLVPAGGVDAVDPWAQAMPQAATVGTPALVQKASISAAAPFHGRVNGSDLDCLTTAVYYEARGEGQAGQAAVAQVILNRVRHPSYPKSICGVVYQGGRGAGCQFSFVCNGAMNGRKESAAWARARRVADRALDGFVMTSIGNATNFHASRVAPSWGGMIRVAQVGQHVFYSFGGRSGSMRSVPSSAPRAVESVQMAEATSAPAYRVLGPSAHADRGEAKLILASSGAVSAPQPHPASSTERTPVTAPAQSPVAANAAASTKVMTIAAAS
jgi:hypothetical protein